MQEKPTIAQEMMKMRAEWCHIYMKHAIAINGLILAILAGMTAVPAYEALAREADPITITPADFAIQKNDALDRLEELETLGAVSVSTADYARAYRRFQNDLSKVKPPVSEWADSEKERVEKLKQPTDAAWKALGLEEGQTRARLDQRSRDAQAEYDRRQQQLLEQQKLGAEQSRTEQQLRLQEAQIQESEARADYYEELTDDNWNTWYNPWWYSHYPGSPIHRRRHDIRDFHQIPRRPLVPNNYDGRTINQSHRNSGSGVLQPMAPARRR